MKVISGMRVISGMKILVSHPHAAVFANGAARGLSAAGALSAYITGVASVAPSAGARALELLAQARPELRNRVLSGLAPDEVRALGTVELGARLVSRAARLFGRDLLSAYDAMFVAHDAVVARLSWPRADAVYAYEDGARFTFARAERLGLQRIWDLPLPHYVAIEELWRSESLRWPDAMGTPPPEEPPWKKRRKDAELRLATVVSVASAFTRASLLEVGVRSPIVVTPYGFPVGSFRPKARPPDGPFTVLAVGSHDFRKGTPYLLEAWRRAGLREARLRLIGSLRFSPSFLGGYRPFEHVAHLPRSALEAEYQAADLVAFPTLGDGFGVVLQEAMCCGTPVVTTRCGGGPESITDGVDGWIVPERDVDALVDRFRAGARDRQALFHMGERARRRAESWTWEDAGRSLAQALVGLL
jgi:glycosyltransferase involved in cell wall biosynthesis